jgi:hypothetical protein
MAILRYKKFPRTLYKVRVPKIALYSPEELEYYGMPVTVINQGQKLQKYNNEESECYLNITQMIEVYRKGYRIQLLFQDDLVEIYKILEEYLRETQSGIENLNRRGEEVSTEYLSDIDRFAAEIFGLNRHEIVDETINKPAQQWQIIPVANFTGTLTKNNGSMINYATPTRSVVNYHQPEMNQPVMNTQSYFQPVATNYNNGNYLNFNNASTAQPTGAFPFDPRVQTVTPQQTGYMPRYNPVTSTIPNKDQYTDYYHSNMPNVDPTKVQRKSFNPYGNTLNNKGS